MMLTTAVAVILMVLGVEGESAVATVRISTGLGCDLVSLEYVEQNLNLSSPAPPLLDIAGENRIIIKQYENPTDDYPSIIHATDDPRFVHVAAPENDSDPHGKGRYRTTSAIFEVLVGRTSSHVIIIADGKSSLLRLPKTPFSKSKRSIHTLDESIKHTTMQQAGPVETQNNLIFLSAGYKASEEKRFLSDTDKALGYMKLPESALEGFKYSVPFARYASILNIFRVFQPSVDSGADVPRLGVKVNNNLACSYGNPESDVERLLSCNMEKVADLASTAPCGALGKTNVVVVSLVNHNIYGGSGVYHARTDGTTFRQAAFFNGYLVEGQTDKQKSNFASLFFHEVGHAYANLFDEYSFDSNSEGEQKILPNCAFTKSKVPWQGWIDLRSSDPYKIVSQEPVPTCGYTDYFKPSQVADGCIMDKLSATRVCPVCRQAGVLAFYETGFAITNPRCPQQGEVIILEPGKLVWLYTNKRLPKLGDFIISWNYNGKLLDPPMAGQPTSMKVRACGTPCSGGGKNSEHLNLREGFHVFTLIVKDDTDWVLPADRIPQMTVSTTFTVRVVKALEINIYTNSTVRNCNTGQEANLFIAGPDHAPHTSYCDDSNNLTCTVEFKSSIYQQTADLDRVADSIEGVVFGVVGACIGGLLLLLLLIWCCLARDNARRAKCILKEQRPKWLECVRWTMVFSAFLCMGGAATAVTLGLLSYSKFGAIGKILVFGALAVAIILFVIAFVGFTGAWYRSKCALTINGILLGFCLTISISWLVFSIIFHSTVSDRDSWAQSWLEDLWIYLAENEDAMLCSLEEALKCSGYHENCQRIQSEKHCPENCEATHFQSWAVTPCEEVLKGYFENNFTLIIIISAGLVVLMIVACVLNFLLRRSVGRYKKKVRADRDAKGAAPGGRGSGNILQVIASLTWPERRALKSEFGRLDKNGDGTLDKKEFRFFIKTALLYKASKQEIQDVFDRTDRDGSGRISLEEFVDLLGLQADQNKALDLSDLSVLGGNRALNPAPHQDYATPGQYPSQYPGPHPSQYPGPHPSQYPGPHPSQYPGQYPPPPPPPPPHTTHTTNNYYAAAVVPQFNPVEKNPSSEPTEGFSAKELSGSLGDPKPQLYDPDSVHGNYQPAVKEPVIIQQEDDWTVVPSAGGEPYYWNKVTGETTYNNPWAKEVDLTPSPPPVTPMLKSSREKSKKKSKSRSPSKEPLLKDEESVNAWLMEEKAVGKTNPKKPPGDWGSDGLDDDVSINAWLAKDKVSVNSSHESDELLTASFFADPEPSSSTAFRSHRKPIRKNQSIAAPRVTSDGFFSPASCVDLLSKISKSNYSGGDLPSQMYDRLNQVCVYFILLSKNPFVLFPLQQ